MGDQDTARHLHCCWPHLLSNLESTRSGHWNQPIKYTVPEEADFTVCGGHTSKQPFPAVSRQKPK